MALKKQDIAELTLDELKQKIVDERLRYTKLKFTNTISQIDSPIELRKIRRDIARLQTNLTSRLKADKK